MGQYLATTSLLLWLWLPLQLNAQALVGNGLLVNTENAVFLESGRYFVAGSAGVHEVKRQPDESKHCTRDSVAGLTVCEVVPVELDGDTCIYTGMTTDGQRLYAACTVFGQTLSTLLTPVKAALLRIEPVGGDFVVTVSHFAEPTWYNGMEMLDADTLLMSRSYAGTLFNLETSAIDRADITNAENLTLAVSTWLPTSPDYLFPNGLRFEDGGVYFVGGEHMFHIPLQADGTAGTPVKLLSCAPGTVFDDFVIAGEYLAIAEIAVLGQNSLVLADKTGRAMPRRIPTGSTQLSSLAVDPGTFGEKGALIGTSFFQGGIYGFAALHDGS